MKRRLYKRALIIIPVMVLILQSCEKTWEEHYTKSYEDVSDDNLFELIKSNTDLGTFVQMLERTGYDTILSQSQTYTVWAPNNASLSAVDLNNLEELKVLVQNHIARGRYGTSGVSLKPVKMLNGKFVNVSRVGAENFMFGNANITKTNQPAQNGLLHFTDNYMPYTRNIWEFIKNGENIDSLRNFILGMDTFDIINIREIGYDSLGNVIYETKSIYSNPVLTKLGELNNEDSTYTVILPDNQAWADNYARIDSYYIVPESDDFGGIKRQRKLTQWTLIQDIVFRNIIEDPGSMSYITSSYGNTFYSPASVFANAQKYELSNGLAYITPSIPFADTSSWFKPIIVEAEDEKTMDKPSNCEVFIQFGQGNGYTISDNKYIYVEPSTTSDAAKSYTTFKIPNTLSAAYDIYCVFVPASISGETNLIPSKVSFNLTYIFNTTGRFRRLSITPDNNITNVNSITKMLVRRFTFNFANVIDEEYSSIGVRLEVINEAKVAEESAGLFTRSMRIDYIILEPVLE